jgi:hypothetical protein
MGAITKIAATAPAAARAISELRREPEIPLLFFMLQSP